MNNPHFTLNVWISPQLFYYSRKWQIIPSVYQQVSFPTFCFLSLTIRGSCSCQRHLLLTCCDLCYRWGFFLDMVPCSPDSSPCSRCTSWLRSSSRTGNPSAPRARTASAFSRGTCCARRLCWTPMILREPRSSNCPCFSSTSRCVWFTLYTLLVYIRENETSKLISCSLRPIWGSASVLTILLSIDSARPEIR